MISHHVNASETMGCVPPDSQLEAALRFAQAGVPVYPVCEKPIPKTATSKARKTKDPYWHPEDMANGHNSASTDEDQIRNWWKRWPDAMIGMPTGSKSGFSVVDQDIDKETGEPVGEETWEELGVETPLIARTPSGGRHLYFQHVEGCKNTTKKLPGIDTRGEGGAIILPPSLNHELNAAYDWIAGALSETDADQLPKFPLELFDRPVGGVENYNSNGQADAHVIAWFQNKVSATPNNRYARRAFDSELKLLADTKEGGRNDQLNKSTFALGQFVGSGELCEDEVRGELKRTAQSIGLDDAEIDATLKSGLTSGKRQPRDPRQRLKQNDTTRLMNGSALSTSSDIYETYGFDEIINQEPPEWLIDDILPETGLGFIYGPAKCGKTFIALDMALKIATGQPWFGRTTKQRGVLYFAGEGKSGMRNRLRAWRKHNDAKPDEDRFRMFYRGDLQEEGTVDKIIRTANETLDQPGVIVIDTLQRAAAGVDENSTKEMAELIKQVDRIWQETGCLVLILHHSGKDVKQGLRGSSTLSASATTCLKIIKPDKLNPGKIWLEFQKDGPEGFSEEFRLDDVTWTEEPDATNPNYPKDEKTLEFARALGTYEHSSIVVTKATAGVKQSTDRLLQTIAEVIFEIGEKTKDAFSVRRKELVSQVKQRTGKSDSTVIRSIAEAEELRIKLNHGGCEWTFRDVTHRGSAGNEIRLEVAENQEKSP